VSRQNSGTAVGAGWTCGFCHAWVGSRDVHHCTGSWKQTTSPAPMPSDFEGRVLYLLGEILNELRQS
jgi:hypothetical protein